MTPHWSRAILAIIASVATRSVVTARASMTRFLTAFVLASLTPTMVRHAWDGIGRSGTWRSIGSAVRVDVKRLGYRPIPGGDAEEIRSATPTRLARQAAKLTRQGARLARQAAELTRQATPARIAVAKASTSAVVVVHDVIHLTTPVAVFQTAKSKSRWSLVVRSAEIAAKTAFDSTG